ncbi:MAG TPA: heavy metal translocating P-type ATPase [Rhabdochlamydiaceae bacterium]|nr:heavy metal translocating P-type ATPase [Rhabdochlamydiaceae bacterium]
MQKISYRIEELHCAEEMSVLKKALSSHAGIKNLDFNLLHHRLNVTYDPSKIDSQKILTLIASTGMKASPWQESHQASSFWGKHGHLLMTALSGLFLLLALIFQSPPLYILSMLCGAYYVLPRAFASLKRLSPDMNLLLLIAAIGAVAINQWFEGATVIFLFSIATLLEYWSTERARRAISALLQLSPPFARVITQQGSLVEKKVEEIAVGERILVRPGEKIPLDAVVESGISSVNQSPITGESLPSLKNPGDLVFAGTLNEDGALECRVTKKADDTTLAHIIHMIEEARSKRAGSEQWVEKFARIYTPIMLILALLFTLIPPLFFHQEWVSWIYRGLVLLVIACPCALVISTPVSIISGLTSAAREGILIKGGIYLETAGKLNALALDKTGTVTYGRPIVQKIIPLNGHTEKELLKIAMALEKPSQHPIARAILQKAEEMGLHAAHATDFKIRQGLGAEAVIEGRPFWIGSHRFLHEKGQETEEVHQLALNMEDAGHSVIAIGDYTHVCGLISVADEPRKFVKETILAIRELGVKKIVLLTGDNEPTARALAKVCGVDAFYAELLPQDKVKLVEKLTEGYDTVAMVGDGVNDAPAMAAATFGIAMGAMGTDAAFETADVILMTDDLSKIPSLIRHSRRTLQIIKQNIGFSLGLKVLFLILAFFGVATLWMAIAADTGASLLVVFNGLRLLRLR